MTWDNAVFMSPKTADELKLDETNFRWTGGEHGRAEVGRRRAQVRRPQGRSRPRSGSCPGTPTTPSPSTSATAARGPGGSRRRRTSRTRTASRSAGSTPTRCGRPTRRGSPAGLTIAKTNKTYFLACTQGHCERRTRPIRSPASRWTASRSATARSTSTRRTRRSPRSRRRRPAKRHSINENVPGPASTIDKHGDHDDTSTTRRRARQAAAPADDVQPERRALARICPRRSAGAGRWRST